MKLISNAGVYWEQRFHEIAFPRITIVSESVSATVFLESVLTPNTTQQCGSVFLGIDVVG